MNRITARIKRYTRRKRSVRKNIFGVPTKPRLSLTRTGKNMYAQLIDDTSGRTLCSASTIEKDGKMEVGSNCDAAKTIGVRLAEKAKSVGIESVAFDRNGYKFHGRVKALAEGAREGGLKF
ncbi:MAG: 50S ribosomal protein L18 [Phycisphaerae bacterium]|jgi:large subunit ribosomal protein L18|nr:50S ribosomal protein L18 [Phycisphaerae bacterium]MBT6282789.1 50S ribosomal protein L18 [Phycisphaerae bacterium]